MRLRDIICKIDLLFQKRFYSYILSFSHVETSFVFVKRLDPPSTYFITTIRHYTVLHYLFVIRCND